jgi:misacylated tRNA(Ala) deacylase
MDKRTTELFRDDSYLKQCTATVTSIDDRGIQFDQTVFYPHSGGQLGDTGNIQLSNDVSISITDTLKDKTTSELIHQVQDSSALAIGDEVTLQIDWTRRYNLMRFHSCLHLLCALVDAPVNGGSIQQDRARLDFDLREPLDKEELTQKLNEYIERDATISSSWISDNEFDAKPELVRTMSVTPPRSPQGTIRLVEIAGIDLQACGGTHVASTKEIGAMMVRKIENKGKQNRRITVVAAEA